MEFAFKTPPTLQQTAMLKIISEMWSRDNFKARIAEFHGLWDKWSEIENSMGENVSTLQLPQTLKDCLRRIIKPIGLEIYSWWYIHSKRNRNFVLIMPEQFIWTSYGTVDRKKTAEGMVKDENLDFETRYRIACIYCLEDKIRYLWNRMPEEQKMVLYNKIKVESTLELEFDDLGLKDFVAFWTYTVLGEVDELYKLILGRRRSDISCSIDEFAYARAAHGGLEATIEFFLEKLRAINAEKYYFVEKVQYLFEYSTDRFPFVGAVFFLLNQISEEQQTKLLTISFHKVLECLLYWPWQSLFMETARRFWHLMNADMYGEVLDFIVTKIKSGFEDYDYKELFREIRKMGSPTLKGNKFSEQRGVSCLTFYFEAKETDLIELILNDVTAARMKNLVSSSIGLHFECRTLIDREEPDVIKRLRDKGFLIEEM